MSKPYDIPQDIWDTAYEALHPLIKEQYKTSPFSMTQHLGMARAILAERERCARLAETRSPDDDSLDWQVRQQVAKTIRAGS